MEQTRRFILFLTLSLAVLIGWTTLGPRMLPGLFPQPVPKAVQKEDGDAKRQADEGGRKQAAAEADRPVEAPRPVESEPAAKNDGAPEQAAAPKEHRQRTVVLGTHDRDSGYFLRAELTSRGAAVERIQLNDPRYSELTDRDRPLTVVEPADGVFPLATSIPAIDEQLGQRGLRSVHWEVAELVPDRDVTDADGNPVHSAVTFRYVAPDETLQIEKTYRLRKVELPRDAGKRQIRDIRDTVADGYQLDVDLKVTNLAKDERTVSYVLQGPTGLPLENLENTSVFRRVVAGFLKEGGGVKSAATTAKEIAEGDSETWKQPIRYIGVDVQYFAALLIPGGDQLGSSYVEVAEPELVEEADKADHSNISVTLASKELKLAPGETARHTYSLFAGPKRKDLLAAFDATETMDFGWFSLIARGMLAVLNFLHSNLYIPYGIAIIFLTILVRGALFPLSRKQAVAAKKMKELQPRIAELKQKYAGDKEKMARAQMELFSKHGYNPFAGCLPILLQLPIFIGLYRALGNSVDLRMAPFLWIENLAAPDQLFALPFSIPFLGSFFNLLPILTVVLFIAQQKILMPPATDEQTAMQQKMMMYMTLFIGFLFYHVPAGLCIYFIASSLWGLGERKMLDWTTSAPSTEAETTTPPPTTDGKKKPARNQPQPVEKKEGLWARLLAKADEVATARAQAANTNGDAQPAKPSAAPNRNGGKPRGKKKKKSRR